MSLNFKNTIYFSIGLLMLLLGVERAGAQQSDAPSFTDIMGKEPKIVYGGADKPIVQSLGSCDAPKVVDLYSIWGVAISPNQGYWGDSKGVKRNNLVKASDYPSSGGDLAVTDTFYFFFTGSSSDYCGLKQGDYLAMVITFLATCSNADEIDREFNFAFCQNDPTEKFYDKKFESPFTIYDLIGKTLDTRNKLERDFYFSDGVSTWRQNIECYADSSLKFPIAYPLDANMLYDSLNIETDTIVTDTFFMRFIDKTTFAKTVLKRVILTVYPQPQLIVNYDPDFNSIENRIREFGMDDNITITVDNPEEFDSIKYYLNTKYLNKYYLGGSTDPSGAGTITLSALAFTGAEDIIKIAATDKNKCFISSEKQVVINVPMPNVFTPDGDGVNDIFFGGEKFADREFHLEIFNRWGNRLYSGNEGWDGTYLGAEAPPATYYYVLQLKSPDGSTKTFKGTVTLVRNRR